jgi:tight adherence protein B
MLVIAFCGYVFMLRVDARQRRLTRQLEVATLGLSDRSPTPEQRRGIRRQAAFDDRWRKLIYSLLRYDPEASLRWPASRTVIAGVFVAFAMFLVDRMAAPLWMALAATPFTAVLAIRFLFGWQRERYADRLLRQLPDTVQLVVASVRAGMPVSEAFRILSREMQEPTRGEFVRAVAELGLGRPADEALLNIYRRTRVPEYAIFSVTLSVQTKSGGRLAETIEILGDTIRQRIAIAGRAKALAGEAKLSAQVVGGLPFFMGILLSFIHPGYLVPFFSDPRGRVMFAYAVVSWLLGVLTMRQMIKKGTTV